MHRTSRDASRKEKPTLHFYLDLRLTKICVYVFQKRFFKVKNKAQTFKGGKKYYKKRIRYKPSFSLINLDKLLALKGKKGASLVLNTKNKVLY